MTKKNQKYQIIKFDFFDYFYLEKKFLQTDRPTDRPTDRQTFGLIEATSRRLKTLKKTNNYIIYNTI